MTEPSPQLVPVCFVSDLHLFSHRSRGHLIDEEIIAAARRSRVCVLGGDIFDFKWSAHTSHEASLVAAVEWLCRLIETVPECQFHFVLGNHDDLPELLAELPGLATRYANFYWDRFSHARRHRLAHGLYGLLVRAHLHRLIPHAVYPPAIVADRLLKYLREVGHGPEEGVRQVCFGHPHRPLLSYHRGGLEFHNGGAPIGRAQYRIIEVQVMTHTPWDEASAE